MPEVNAPSAPTPSVVEPSAPAMLTGSLPSFQQTPCWVIAPSPSSVMFPFPVAVTSFTNVAACVVTVEATAGSHAIPDGVVPGLVKLVVTVEVFPECLYILSVFPEHDHRFVPSHVIENMSAVGPEKLDVIVEVPPE